MTRNEFNTICSSLLIDPDIALENDKVRSALKEKDSEMLKKILTEEF